MNVLKVDNSWKCRETELKNLLDQCGITDAKIKENNVTYILDFHENTIDAEVVFGPISISGSDAPPRQQFKVHDGYFITFKNDNDYLLAKIIFDSIKHKVL